MSQLSAILTRRTALTSVVCLLLGAAGAVEAGIPKTSNGNNGTNGPYGLPPLKKVKDTCSLSHDEEQAVLRVYDDYRHKEHEEMQAKDKTASTGKSDCIAAVKQVLTPDEQKKFDELIGGNGKKKKT